MPILKKYQTRIFILCWVSYALIYFGRVNISIAMPLLTDALDANNTIVGGIGSVFFYCYAIGQLINGFLSDKASSRIYIFIGLIITGISNILFSFSREPGLSMLFWGLNGIGQSMLWANIVKTAGMWYSSKQYNKVMVGMNTSMVLGYLLAWGGSSLILRIFHWQYIFVIPGLVIIVFAFVWLVLMKDSPEDVGLKLEDMEEKNSDIQNTETLPLKSVFFSTGLLFIAFACISQGMVKEGFGIWAPTMVMQLYNLDITKVGFYVLLLPIMNLVGILLAGYLNKLCKNNELKTSLLLFLIAIIFLMALRFFGDSSLYIGIIGIGLASGIIYGVNTMLLGVFPVRYSKYNRAAFVTGFLDFCSYAGAAMASVLIGSLIDRGSPIHTIFTVFTIILLIASAMIIPPMRQRKNKL